jgi:DNA polymerase I-like protein with 3'-5' exonuclease and polymerase domains
VQGSAADGQKASMIALTKLLPPELRMVCTVHDELVFECPEAMAKGMIERIAKVMVETMEAMFEGVPMGVDSRISDSWSKSSR